MCITAYYESLLSADYYIAVSRYLGIDDRVCVYVKSSINLCMLNEIREHVSSRTDLASSGTGYTSLQYYISARKDACGTHCSVYHDISSRTDRYTVLNIAVYIKIAVEFDLLSNKCDILVYLINIEYLDIIVLKTDLSVNKGKVLVCLIVSLYMLAS